MENAVQEDTNSTFADFDLAFEAASGLPEPEVHTKEPEPEVVAEAPEVIPEPEAPVAPEVVAPPVVAPKAEVSVEEIVAKVLAEKEAVATAAKETAEKESARASKETVSADEQEILNTLETNFPEVTAANAVLSRVIMAKVENMVEQRVAAVLEQMAPIVATTQTVARNAHEQAILAKHPDAFIVLPKVEEWVATQPKILRNAYDKVLDAGSTEEIIELYDVFKKDTGSAQTPVSQGAAPDAAAAKAAAEAAVKEAKLKAQEGIKSRQTSQQSGLDEDDFEGAFNQEAAKA